MSWGGNIQEVVQQAYKDMAGHNDGTAVIILKYLLGTTVFT